jgi:hypothetical protein
VLGRAKECAWDNPFLQKWMRDSIVQNNKSLLLLLLLMMMESSKHLENLVEENSLHQSSSSTQTTFCLCLVEFADEQMQMLPTTTLKEDVAGVS